MQLIECLPSLFLVRRGCLTCAVPGVGMKTCIPQQSKPYLGFTETSKLFPPVLLLVATLAPSFGHWLLPLLLPWSPACCQCVRSPVPRLVGFDMLSCMVWCRLGAAGAALNPGVDAVSALLHECWPMRLWFLSSSYWTYCILLIMSFKPSIWIKLFLYLKIE